MREFMSTENGSTHDGTPVPPREPPALNSGPEDGEEELIDAITTHVERHIGPANEVYHEVLSEYVHIDVLHVRPTAQHPFHVLVTAGASELAMTTPPEIGSRRLELIVCLPPEWPMDSTAHFDERYGWPQEWMRRLGRYPHQFETYFAVGHTIPSADPPEPLGPGTRLAGWIFLPPVTLSEAARELTLRSGERVDFLAMVPLYADEISYKVKHGLRAFLDRLDDGGVTELIDPARPSVLPPRRGWRSWFSR